MFKKMFPMNEKIRIIEKKRVKPRPACMHKCTRVKNGYTINALGKFICGINLSILF